MVYTPRRGGEGIFLNPISLVPWCKGSQEHQLLNEERGFCLSLDPLKSQWQKPSEPPVFQVADAVGEILLSLSYLPTAERLTVVVVKAKNLIWTHDKTTAGKALQAAGSSVPPVGVVAQLLSPGHLEASASVGHSARPPTPALAELRSRAQWGDSSSWGNMGIREREAGRPCRRQRWKSESRRQKAGAPGRNQGGQPLPTLEFVVEAPFPEVGLHPRSHTGTGGLQAGRSRQPRVAEDRGLVEPKLLEPGGTQGPGGHSKETWWAAGDEQTGTCYFRAPHPVIESSPAEQALGDSELTSAPRAIYRMKSGESAKLPPASCEGSMCVWAGRWAALVQSPAVLTRV